MLRTKRGRASPGLFFSFHLDLTGLVNRVRDDDDTRATCAARLIVRISSGSSPAAGIRRSRFRSASTAVGTIASAAYSADAARAIVCTAASAASIHKVGISDARHTRTAGACRRTACIAADSCRASTARACAEIVRAAGSTS